MHLLPTPHVEDGGHVLCSCYLRHMWRTVVMYYALVTYTTCGGWWSCTMLLLPMPHVEDGGHVLCSTSYGPLFKS